MALYIGHCGRAIRYVGSEKPVSSPFEFITADNSLRSIPAKDLISQYEVRRGRVVPKALKDHKSLRVAFVGVYRIKCGISTYSEWLWSEMARMVGEYRIFAEVAPGAPNEPNVVRCWQRGRSLVPLIEAIREYDPDVVYIQHEYGIFPVARHWISLITALQDFRVITTMHSVFLHKDKLICEGVVPEIVVHTNAAAKILSDTKKVHGKIHVIPHGCFPCLSQEKYWNLYHSNHTLIQFGFGFKYKGWSVALQIVSALKNEFPDVFFTGLFSETDLNKDFHDEYYRELNALIEKYGVRGNVGLIRGFQSDECLDSYLRTNRIAIFPYIPNGEHTVYGCSGAARLAMSKGIPVIASNVPLFDDLDGICPRPGSVSEFCKEIRKLFTESAYVAQLQRQKDFLANNSWVISAERYLNLL